MEKAYLDENCRELELTKHLSLRLDFPLQYLQLRTTGYCEIEIPEWMFDRDYPGHYLRRIKNVTLTLPCVAGPYTGVHCRLTLLSSSTRIRPDLRPPAHACCNEQQGHVPHDHPWDDHRGTRRGGQRDRHRHDRCNDHRDEYLACLDDPRFVREYGARESIATSSGQNDSGLFELSFHDERYLPFEYQGAVSRWRIELPPENNYFDLDTVTDVVLHLNYTARDGGDVLRMPPPPPPETGCPATACASSTSARTSRTRGRRCTPGRRRPRSITGCDSASSRPCFPFVPGRRTRTIDQLAIILRRPAPPRATTISYGLHHGEAPAVAEGVCVRDGDGRGIFAGLIDLADCPLGPIDDRRQASCTVEIPHALHRAERIFVIARYDGPACERD